MCLLRFSYNMKYKNNPCSPSSSVVPDTKLEHFLMVHDVTSRALQLLSAFVCIFNLRPPTGSQRVTKQLLRAACVCFSLINRDYPTGRRRMEGLRGKHNKRREMTSSQGLCVDWSAPTYARGQPDVTFDVKPKTQTGGEFVAVCGESTSPP